MFYLLSIMSGILECGWIFIGVLRNMPLWMILSYPLAYHIGNLFPLPIRLEKKSLYALASGSAVLAVLNVVVASQVVGFVLDCICLAALSTVMQSVRSGMKSDGNRLIKRICRVGGFLLAPLSVLVSDAILIVISVYLIFALRAIDIDKAGLAKLTTQHGYSAIMTFHQLHYFLYAHITLAVMSMRMGIVMAALLFCGTWITYMSVEPIAQRFHAKTLPLFFAGHIGVCLVLCLMCVMLYGPMFIPLWLITGFGGGVVFTIVRLAEECRCADKISMTSSENIGHTCGLLIAVTASAVCQQYATQLMLVAAAASALLAAISMIATLKRGENK